MNKQKYLAMGITFLILIAITPFVFSKLMNAKLDKMVEKLNKEGYKIELIEDKSTYLKTDKVFLVDIPGEKLNNVAIDKIKFKIETIFNNLPVTRVDFKGVLKKIDLVNKEYNEDVNAIFDEKVKFFATTPNFKVYTYKIEDINLALNNFLISFKGIKGIYEYSDIKSNKLHINDILFQMPLLSAEIKNFQNNTFYKKNNLKNENKFNFYLNLQNNPVEINNVKISTTTDLGKRTNVITKISFDKLTSNLLKTSSFVFNINFLNLDTNTLALLLASNNEEISNKLSMELIKKGLEIDLYSKAKNIELMNNKLGYYLIDSKFKILPDANLEEDLRLKNLKFLNSNIHYESTPQLAALLMNLYPKSAFIFALAKKEGGKVTLDISLKDSKIFVNGEELK